MVFYRKYRPQTIDELDNEDVRTTLSSVLSSPNPPHAFLFTGPKGLGKTSSARIVAKVLNCERLASRTVASSSKNGKLNAKRSDELNASDIEPCNACDMCTSITNGTNLDVLEIDAASNRGIDEIRDLREKIRLAPVSASKKVYIIDEVHMLTTEAFNALLKTLEEPPSHAVFILATTEPQKVPATIVSRCLHIAFHKATEEELLRSFKRIVSGEKLLVEDDALIEIAKLSDGGFRDGAKVLEELVFAAKGEKITLSLVEERYHSVSTDKHIETLLSYVAKRDMKKSILLVESLSEQGVDMHLFLERLLLSIHALLLSKVGEGEGEKVTFSLSELCELSDLLQKAHVQARFAVIPSLPLELALIEFITFGQHKDTTSTKNPSSLPVVTKVEEDEQSMHAFRKKVGELHKKRAIDGEEEKKREEVSVASPNLMAYKADGELTKEWLSEFWQTFIIKLKEYNHTISGLLRGCHLKSFDRKTLIIQTSYAFHKDKLSEETTIAALESAAKYLAGNPVTVRIELKISR